MSNKDTIVKTCPICNKEFTPHQCAPYQIYCSRKCRSKSRRKTTIKEKTCLICGEKFTTTIGHPKQEYCSEKCREEGRIKNQRKYPRPIKKTCPRCGKEFTAHGSDIISKTYCSTECRTLNRRVDPLLDKHLRFCVICGKEFIASHFHQTCCSEECQVEKNKELGRDYCRRRYASLEYRIKYLARNRIKAIEERELREGRHIEDRRKKYAEGLNSNSLRDAPIWHENPNKPLNIESEFILLTSDWHIPFDNPEYVECIFQIAEDWEIPDIAIIGDFWDCDNYSRYTRYDVETTFQKEIENVSKRLRLITEHFKQAFFCVGNHEARFLALNAGKLKFGQMMNLTGIIEGYVVTDNRWMTLNNNWRLTHPRSYSQTKLSVAKRLADKYLMNIINTHGHYTSGTPIGHPIMKPDYHVVKDRDTKATKGVFRVADIGGLFDTEKMEYLTLVDSVYPRLNPGFAIYDHGEVTIFDLEKYLTEEFE